MMSEETEFDAGNYYGALMVKQEGDKYFWCVENYDGNHWTEIPKPLYLALIKWGPRDE